MKWSQNWVTRGGSGGFASAETTAEPTHAAVAKFTQEREWILPRPNYKPSDTVIADLPALQGASLMEFWTWAFSDLCDDDLKGIFAEWLVMKLLGIPSLRRMNWANSDIITSEGVRIEVKASSYWQSWKLLDEFGAVRASPLYPVSDKTRITFSGLKARDAVTVPDSSTPQQFKSHVYVFAFQHEMEIVKWNAMDLSQWEFYVLPMKRLQQLGWKSISLTMLRSEQRPLSASAFVDAANTAIREAGIEIQSVHGAVSS